MSSGTKIAGVVSMVIVTSVLALAIAAGGLGYVIPPPHLRSLADWYLKTALNPYLKYFTVNSPEAVTSIVWDYRGLDTLFETTVFFLAIIGSIALMRGIHIDVKELKECCPTGMSPIVKTVTRVTVGMILAVSASIALHGHLTPGGGFQGGATAAVAPLLVMVVFSLYFVSKHGLSEEKMLTLRTAGLLGIAFTAFAALIIGYAFSTHAYVFQNQPKAEAPVGLPAYMFNALTSGTLIFFNLFEFFAVAAGFTIVFLLLSIPEVIVKKHSGVSEE
ncbi:MAG: Na(+)/H(+) antiporter subunit B [Desulfurococcales archaeon]|nr:Na(+)/H(+) antiporter subunit B [Desulfurococcales archaeon]